jgi:solute carrier family 30 (zinc transporter), member 1
MLGVFIHVIGDALNNIGVIIAALVIWKTNYAGRFYADPGASMGIAIMILLSALPLVKSSGSILLQSAPRGVDLGDVKHDLERVCDLSTLVGQATVTLTLTFLFKIDGIESVHELHIWRLDQKKAIASAHVVVSDQNVTNFMEKARTVSECLHAYGIHSATLQPEVASPPPTVLSTADKDIPGTITSATSAIRRRRVEPAGCQILCGSLCENLMCCT